jgi:hypothetical protein
MMLSSGALAGAVAANAPLFSAQVPEFGIMAPRDPILAVAFWTGIGALFLTLLLAAQIVRLRVALRRRQRREARVLARWRPLLNSAIVGEVPGALPPLAANERDHFIKLWVHLQASLRGEAGAALNDIAHRLQLDLEARGMQTRAIDDSATTFQRDKPALERLLPLLEADFGAWDGFGGMAVHEYR